MIVEKSSSERVNFTFREATMADRKGRSVTFKLPYKMNVGLCLVSTTQDNFMERTKPFGKSSSCPAQRPKEDTT